MKLLVSGSLAFDRIMDFRGRFADHIVPEQIHTLNVSFVSDEVKITPGGTAGNICYTLGLLQERPVLLGEIGKDGEDYLKNFAKQGVMTNAVKIVADQETASAYIMTDQDDNQVTCFVLGAMRHRWTFAQVSPLLRTIGSGRVMAIIAPGNLSLTAVLVKAYRAKQVPFIFDPGQQMTAMPLALFREAMGWCNIFISNEYEFELAAKRLGLSSTTLRDRLSISITTFGPKGSEIYTHGKRLARVAAVKLRKVVDPTGAGDAYRAGLLKGLALGYTVEIAAELGSLAASYCVAEAGTQRHSFTLDEFKERGRKHFGKKFMTL